MLEEGASSSTMVDLVACKIAMSGTTEQQSTSSTGRVKDT